MYATDPGWGRRVPVVYGDGVRASASSIIYSCATRRSKGEAGNRDSETDRGRGKRKRRGAVGGVHSGTTHTPMNSYREAKRPKDEGYVNVQRLYGAPRGRESGRAGNDERWGG